MGKKCSQFQNLILITVPTCLYFGGPNKFVIKAYGNNKWNKQNNKNTFNNVFIY